MKGMIRVIAGLILVAGCAGGLDNATDAQLLPLIGLALVGLGIMASGVSAAKTA